MLVRVVRLTLAAFSEAQDLRRELIRKYPFSDV
jgi:hypothetical protein